MMFSLKASETKPLTRELVLQFSQMEASPTERLLRSMLAGMSA